MNQQKVVTAILIGLFAIQFLSPAYSVVEITGQEKTDKVTDSITVTKKPTINTVISLEEKSTKFQFSEVMLSVVKKPQTAKTVFVTEEMTMTNNKDDETSIHMIKKENNFAIQDCPRNFCQRIQLDYLFVTLTLFRKKNRTDYRPMIN